MEEYKNVPKLTSSTIKLLINVNNVVTNVRHVVLLIYVLNVRLFLETITNRTDNAFLNVQLVNFQCQIKYAKHVLKIVMLVLLLQHAIVVIHLANCYLLLVNV
jgi:hypothetical protein